jgi:glutamate dehydrogenase
MSAREERRKAELIDQVAALAQRRIGGAKGEAAALFLLCYYANVAMDDLAARSAEDLYGAGLALWQFGKTRQPGTALVRVYNPRLAEHGWTSRHTVIEIVNDDMPFLVDSVTAELNQRELSVHLVIHPIVRLTRDSAGRAGAIADLGTPESFMHIEVDEQGSPAVLADIQRGVEAVLADVRAAVSDWPQTLKRVESVIAELGERPPPVPAHDIASARAFLEWMKADHFTFLGYREYAYAGDGSDLRSNVIQGSGLGMCRDESFVVFEGLRNLASLPPDVQEFVRQPILLKVNKANRRSTVHRPVFLDAISLKTFDAAGRVAGERLFLGLFTSIAYTQSPLTIPLLAEKVKRIMARAGFAPNSHDGKALQHILDTFSRNELFQASEDELFEMSLGILRLQDRQRTALFVRKDNFERFVSCFVYVPRDRYTTELRIRFQKILEAAFAGTQAAFSTHFGDDSPLVRIHSIIKTSPGRIPEYSLPDIGAQLAEASRSFADRLRDTLIGVEGEERGLARLRRYATAFPTAYREHFGPEVAVADIAKIESVLAGDTALAVNLYRAIDAPGDEIRLRVFRAGRPVPLSDVLPMLENMGLKVMGEVPYEIAPGGIAYPVWIHDFTMTARDVPEIDITTVKASFEDCFAQVWAGAVESDGFNRLVLGAQMATREVVVLRTYAKYLRQVGIPFSQAYMEDTLARYPKIARRLVDLFLAGHDPEDQKDAETKTAGLRVEIEHLLEDVTSLDDDRIIRRFLNLVRSTLRTNFFQRGADAKPKSYISVKLNSQTVEELPLPRPHVEIFVYSPRVEAVHLRGGKVARGGIRWSDRREDFRTEILGLMKAQMAKNAVIVPVGAKGGFFVKHPPPAEAGREAIQAEAIACYTTLMRGLLDITDNLGPDGVIAPKDVVRHDDDDPYLVVAADKGTATFSDIANSVSLDYKFWLGDAFASGGSAGYDHKEMGITARGAWEAVKRHFRELGRDIQTADFTVVGVGDMSGDVFGNGMLQSRHTKMLAAFDHRHIFIDPAPDPQASFAERERLFHLARSSWADYNAKLISTGGGVFERKAKSIKLTAEIKALFGIEASAITPADLIRTLLRARVDLLWLGGIGTYVKAAGESNADAGDRANDALRVDGRELMCKVVGEGANLGVTQRGRVEYSRLAQEGKGGRINTDAIDNSAGVSTSDHEVNIKILVGDVMQRGDMTLKQRDALLASMTDEVAQLVLRDNYQQPQAMSVTEAEGSAALERAARLIRMLEKTGRLNRAIEFLPDDEEITRRGATGGAMTRPELAVLLAYTKMWLYDQLLPTALPDDTALSEELLRYFPTALRRDHREAAFRHRLRREIIATEINNDLVNRAGPFFVNELMDRLGASPDDIARAYLASVGIFALRPLWASIEALDNQVHASVQYRMLRDTGRLLDRSALWLLRFMQESGGAKPFDIAATIARFAPGVTALRQSLRGAIDRHRAADLAKQAQAFVAVGVPEELAETVAALGELSAGPDLVRVSEAAGATPAPIDAAARIYFAIGDRLGFNWLREAAQRIKPETSWQRLAIAAHVDDLYAQQAELAARAVATAQGVTGIDALAATWIESHRGQLARFDAMLAELKAAPSVDLAALTVAGRELRSLIAR